LSEWIEPLETKPWIGLLKYGIIKQTEKGLRITEEMPDIADELSEGV
jgi:hypothetical protein